MRVTFSQTVFMQIFLYFIFILWDLMRRPKKVLKIKFRKIGELEGSVFKTALSLKLFYFLFDFKNLCKFQKEKKILSLQRNTTVAVIGSYCSHCKVLNKCTENNSHHNELHSYHYYEWTHFELLSRYTSVYNEILLICDERIYSILVMIYACIYVLNNFPYK